MGKKSVTLLPKTGKILEQMGEQIRLARMRRKISVALAAERAGVSRASVWAVEKGSAAVAIGIYAAVLHAISGMDTDLLKVAADDELGQKLHDIELLKKISPGGQVKQILVYKNWLRPPRIATLFVENAFTFR